MWQDAAQIHALAAAAALAAGIPFRARVPALGTGVLFPSLGEQGVAWAAARAGCEVFAVDTGRRVVRTGGVPMAGAG